MTQTRPTDRLTDPSPVLDLIDSKIDVQQLPDGFFFAADGITIFSPSGVQISTDAFARLIAALNYDAELKALKDDIAARVKVIRTDVYAFTVDDDDDLSTADLLVTR